MFYPFLSVTGVVTISKVKGCNVKCKFLFLIKKKIFRSTTACHLGQYISTHNMSAHLSRQLFSCNFANYANANYSTGTIGRVNSETTCHVNTLHLYMLFQKQINLNTSWIQLSNEKVWGQMYIFLLSGIPPDPAHSTPLVY